MASVVRRMQPLHGCERGIAGSSPSWRESLFAAGYSVAAGERRLQVVEALVRESKCQDRGAAAKADVDVGSQRLMLCRHLLRRAVASILKRWLNPLREKPLQPLAGGRRDGLLNW